MVSQTWDDILVLAGRDLCTPVLLHPGLSSPVRPGTWEGPAHEAIPSPLEWRDPRRVGAGELAAAEVGRGPLPHVFAAALEVSLPLSIPRDRAGAPAELAPRHVRRRGGMGITTHLRCQADGAPGEEAKAAREQRKFEHTTGVKAKLEAIASGEKGLGKVDPSGPPQAGYLSNAPRSFHPSSREGCCTAWVPPHSRPAGEAARQPAQVAVPDTDRGSRLGRGLQGPHPSHAPRHRMRKGTLHPGPRRDQAGRQPLRYLPARPPTFLLPLPPITESQAHWMC